MHAYHRKRACGVKKPLEKRHVQGTNPCVHPEIGCPALTTVTKHIPFV